VLQPALRDVASDDARELQHRAERAIFDRALELGWTPERFEIVDRGRSRDDPTVERVGKRYQWIGMYETLGRIADHHSIKPDWGETVERPYSLAEQLVWRDIDPTVLARKPTVEATESQRRPWFSPSEATFRPGVTNEYPADMDGVQDPLDLITVTADDGVPWLVLLTCPKWQQPQPTEDQALRMPRLVVWMQVHAYLVRSHDADALSQWAAGKDWFGRWMPDTADVHNVLLGAHHEDPQGAAASGEIEWWDRGNGPQPCDLWQCGAWYGGTGTSRDASADDETRGYAPPSDSTHSSDSVVCRLPLARRFGCRRPRSGGPHRRAYESAHATGHRRATRRPGPNSLVWTVLIGKELHRGDLMPPGDDYRWVSASASHLLGLEGVRRIGATAMRCRPGPATEALLAWPVREAEDYGVYATFREARFSSFAVE
jgi:hypothetical protein